MVAPTPSDILAAVRGQKGFVAELFDELRAGSLDGDGVTRMILYLLAADQDPLRLMAKKELMKLKQEDIEENEKRKRDETRQ